MRTPKENCGIHAGKVGDVFLTWDNRNDVWIAEVDNSLKDCEIVVCWRDFGFGKPVGNARNTQRIFGNTRKSSLALSKYLTRYMARLNTLRQMELPRLYGLVFEKGHNLVELRGTALEAYLIRTNNEVRKKIREKTFTKYIRSEEINHVLECFITIEKELIAYSSRQDVEFSWCSVWRRNFRGIVRGRLVVTDGHQIMFASGSPHSLYDNALDMGLDNEESTIASIKEIEDSIRLYMECYEWNEKKKNIENAIYSFNKKYSELSDPSSIALSDVWVILKAPYGAFSRENLTRLGWRFCYMDDGWIINMKDLSVDRALQAIHGVDRSPALATHADFVSH
ncbi:hypothetical protein [Acetobacter malorum]|nr:hypothetical protein [Acetobacter malorum]